MLKTLVLAMALASSGAAIAQQAQPGPAASDAKAAASPNAAEQSAAPGEGRANCDLMSREEMLMCQATKQGDVSGARSSLCDAVSMNIIERCLKRQESVASDSANEHRDRTDLEVAQQGPR